MMTDPAASRPGTHLEPDQMADLFEGLLDPATAGAAQAHLASCRLCSADFALITGETDLGDLLPPAPIPQDVAIRVEAALHREPPLGAPSPSAQHAAPPRRRRRFRIALGSLAGACLVIAGGIGAFAALDTGGSRSSTASSGAAGSQNQGGAHFNSKTAGSEPSFGGAAPGAATPPSAGPSKQAPMTAGVTIEQQAQNLLAHPETAASGTQLANFACPPAAEQGSGMPLAGAETTYAGQSAELLVYATPGSTTGASVYVISLGPSCVKDHPGQVLYQAEITRP